MATEPDDPELAEWAARQPAATTGDPLWRLDAYRHAAFVLSLARVDARRISRDPVHSSVAPQLLSAVGSIAANLAEGYGRSTIADRVRFMSYALGSVREAGVWYDASIGALPELEFADRTARLVRVRRIILGLLSHLRAKMPKQIDRW